MIAHLSEGRTLDSARVTLVQLCTALGVFAILSSFTGRAVSEVAVQMSAHSWLLTPHLALLCTVFAFVVQTWATHRTSAARSVCSSAPSRCGPAQSGCCWRVTP